MFGDYIHKNIQSTLFNRIDALNRKKVDNPLDSANPNSNQDSFLMGATWANVTAAVPNVTTNPYSGEIMTVWDDHLFRLSSIHSMDHRANDPLSIRSDFWDNTKWARDPGTWRGHNGITGIEVTYLNQTTLSTTITWVLNDINEFEVYQNAFLKPGRVLMIEFGWSREKPQEIPDIETAEEMFDFFKANQKLMTSYGGDYFATCGTIKNFDYTLAEGGRYQCTTEVVSMGQQLFKSPIGRDKDQETPSLVNEFQEKNPPEANKRLTRLKNSKLNKATKEKIRETILNAGGNSFETVISRFNTYITNHTPIASTDKSQTYTRNGKSWCTWGWFEDNILNTYFGLLIKKSPKNATSDIDDDWIARFNSSFRKVPDDDYTHRGRSVYNRELDPDSLYEPNLCQSDVNLFTKSFDIIFPGRTIEISENVKAGVEAKFEEGIHFLKEVDKIYQDMNDLFSAFEPVGLQNKRGIIRNIVFSADILKEYFSGTTIIGQSIKNLWAYVNIQYGGFWDFDVLSDTNDTTLVGVFDRKITRVRVKDSVTFPHTRNLSTKDNPIKTFQFNVYSTDSLIKDLTFATQMSAEMMTQAVYSGNNSSTVTKNGIFGGVPGDKDGRAVKAFAALQNFNYLDSKTVNKEIRVKKVLKDGLLDSVTTPYMISQVAFRDKTGTLTTKTLNAVLSSHEKQYQEAEAFIIADEQSDELAKKITKTYNWFDVNKALNDRGIIYDQTGKMLETYSKTMLFLLNKTDKAQRKTDVPIPFTCNFSIAGISGIKLYDYFTIDYLPELYRKYSVFQVTGITQTIDTTGWNTAISAMMRVDMDSLADDIGRDVPDNIKTELNFIDDMHIIDTLNATLLPSTPAKGIGKRADGTPKKFASSSTKFAHINPGSLVSLEELKGIDDEIFDVLQNEGISTWDQYRRIYSAPGMSKANPNVSNANIRGIMSARVKNSVGVRKQLFSSKNFPTLKSKRLKLLRRVRQTYTMPLNISTPKSIFETSK